MCSSNGGHLHQTPPRSPATTAPLLGDSLGTGKSFRKLSISADPRESVVSCLSLFWVIKTISPKITLSNRNHHSATASSLHRCSTGNVKRTYSATRPLIFVNKLPKGNTCVNPLISRYHPTFSFQTMYSRADGIVREPALPKDGAGHICPLPPLSLLQFCFRFCFSFRFGVRVGVIGIRVKLRQCTGLVVYPADNKDHLVQLLHIEEHSWG